MENQYSLKDFLPLISMFALVMGFTVIRQIVFGYNFNAAMLDFMAAFFLIFGLLKVINLFKFAEAFAIYDLLAARSRAYAMAYPFIEFGLGLAYLFRLKLFYTNVLSLIIMSVGAVGVGYALYKGERLMCACLGVVFKVPMTYVTLLEDLLMGSMALYMLLT